MISISIVFKGDEIQRFVSEKTSITIGRMKNSDICLDNIGISKRHARIFEQNGIYLVEDCNSTNGTNHNNKPVTTPQKLKEGDIISIIKYRLTIYFTNAEDDNKNIDSYIKTLRK